MTDQTQAPLRKVTGASWWRNKRFANLACGHRVEIAPTEAMPERTGCTVCPPDPAAT